MPLENFVPTWFRAKILQNLPKRKEFICRARHKVNLRWILVHVYESLHSQHRLHELLAQKFAGTLRVWHEIATCRPHIWAAAAQPIYLSLTTRRPQAASPIYLSKGYSRITPILYSTFRYLRYRRQRHGQRPVLKTGATRAPKRQGRCLRWPLAAAGSRAPPLEAREVCCWCDAPLCKPRAPQWPMFIGGDVRWFQPPRHAQSARAGPLHALRPTSSTAERPLCPPLACG